MVITIARLATIPLNLCGLFTATHTKITYCMRGNVALCNRFPTREKSDLVMLPECCPESAQKGFKEIEGGEGGGYRR